MKKLSLLEAFDDFNDQEKRKKQIILRKLEPSSPGEHDSSMRMFDRMKNYNAKRPSDTSCFAILHKANDLADKMFDGDESVKAKDVVELIQQYFKMRREGAPEPQERVDNKPCDFLANQLVDGLRGGDFDK